MAWGLISWASRGAYLRDFTLVAIASQVQVINEFLSSLASRVLNLIEARKRRLAVVWDLCCGILAFLAHACEGGKVSHVYHCQKSGT